jgi:hypothetical protein
MAEFNTECVQRIKTEVLGAPDRAIRFISERLEEIKATKCLKATGYTHPLKELLLA